MWDDDYDYWWDMERSFEIDCEVDMLREEMMEIEEQENNSES